MVFTLSGTGKGNLYTIAKKIGIYTQHKLQQNTCMSYNLTMRERERERERERCRSGAY